MVVGFVKQENVLPQWAEARREDPVGFNGPYLLSFSWYATCKMAVEWVAALLLLVLTAPLMLLAAVLVKLTSPGPVLYQQARVGWRGRTFTIFKIRTMWHDCERQSGPRWSTAGDPRITPVGRFLRRTHLDELPQLWNVLRCEMSLVGPRPERPEFVTKLVQEIPNYADRLLVRPGVTGLAQVQLHADSDLESVRRKLTYDRYYVQNLGFWLDLRILLCTAFKVLGIPFSALQKLAGVPKYADIELIQPSLPAPDGTPAVQMISS
jgi:lipopolysaccharide/colanic/teichoic acid biosynthesis glycosyltransferase